MKILIILDAGIKLGGAEKNVMALAHYLTSLACEVYMASTKTTRKFTKYDPVKKDFFSIDIKTNTNIRLLNTLIIYNKVKPNVVVSFLTPANIRVSILSAFKLIKSTVVLFERNSIRDRDRGYKYEIGRLFFYRFSDYLTGNSLSICNELRKISDPSRVYYYYNFIDEGLKPIDSDSNGNNLRILIGGRLQRQKRFDSVIKAFSKISNSDDVLMVVGSGSEQIKLKNLAKDCKGKGSVFFLGELKPLSFKELKPNIFIMSSEYEGAPNMMLEALASGVATISSEIEFAKEFSHFSAYMIYDGSLKGLENDIKFLRKSTEREKLIKNSKIFIKHYRKASIDNNRNFWNIVLGGISKERYES